MFLLTQQNNNKNYKISYSMFKLSSTKPLLFILIGFFFTSCDKKGFNPLNEVDKYISAKG